MSTPQQQPLLHGGKPIAPLNNLAVKIEALVEERKKLTDKIDALKAQILGTMNDHKIRHYLAAGVEATIDNKLTVKIKSNAAPIGEPVIEIHPVH